MTAIVRPATEHDRLFRTDHLVADLKGRSVRGGAVTLSAQGTKFVLQVGSTAVLARLLTPEDFGLVAMVAAFTGFVSLFKDLGLSMATVQRDQITHAQVSTLFWINVALSLILMGVAAALAPVVAWFYGEPRLSWIMIAVAATFVFGGLTAQHTALLRRQMRYSTLATIEVTAMGCGIATAITMASFGFGYWSLVAMGAAASLANLGLVWSFSPWRPGLPRRDSGVRSMLRFGGNLTGFNVVNYFSRHADNVLIGWWWGAGALGLYAKAYSLLMMPIKQLNSPLSSVIVTSLSRLQNDSSRYRSYYAKAVRAVAGAGMPLVAFAFVSAEELVLLLLGGQWLEAVPLFRLLAPAAFLGTLSGASGWVFMSTGQTHRQFRWGILTSLLIVAAFCAGLPWGPSGVAAAFSIMWCTQFVPTVIYCYRGTPLTLDVLARAVALPAGASLFAGSIAALVKVSHALPDSLGGRILFLVVLFGCTYGACWLATSTGRSALRDLSYLRRSAAT